MVLFYLQRYMQVFSVFVFVLVFSHPSYAGWDASQTIALKKGWNAVFLTVEPHSTDPNDVFSGIPVTNVSTYYSKLSSMQFVKDLDEEPWAQNKWHRWIPDDQADSFLTNLYAINAGQAYLIHVTEDYEWTLSGTAKLLRTTWKPNSFNLVGFAVDANSPPTFNEYFSGSKAHQQLLAFEMVANKWQQIKLPNLTYIQPGKAYWVYSRGASNHQGPLDVKPSIGQTLEYLSNSQSLAVMLKNPSDTPVSIDVSLEGGNMPIKIEQKLPLGSELFALNENPVQTLDSDNRYLMNLAVQQKLIPTGSTIKSLLVFQGGGIKQVIPVSANR